MAASVLVLHLGLETKGQNPADVVESGEGLKVVCFLFYKSFHQFLDQLQRNIGFLQYQDGQLEELRYVHTQVFLFLCPLRIDFKERAHHFHPRLLGKSELFVKLQRFIELGCPVLPAKEEFG
jgi:hypothetical protein